MLNKIRAIYYVKRIERVAQKNVGSLFLDIQLGDVKQKMALDVLKDKDDHYNIRTYFGL